MIRDLKLDNLRGLAIVLVVLTQFTMLSSFYSSYAFNFTSKYVYYYHMHDMIYFSYAFNDIC